MRVLQLGKYYYPFMGGIETHLFELCGRLAQMHQVEAVVCHTGLRTVHEQVGQLPLTRVGTLGRAASTEICPALPLELSRRRYDVLHLHTPNPMAMMAYWIARKPARHALIVTHHSDVVRQPQLRRTFEPIFRRVMSRADAIIATSQRYLDTSEELRPYRAKCVVIPYGIETGTRNPPDRTRVEELRRKHGKRIVLGVGRLIYYKGFDVLIEAMASIDGTLLLVGDGPLRRDLQERAATLGIARRVVFVGEVHNHEMAAYHAASDVFAFPSVARSEAFGIAQLEAMSAGLPVVNTLLDSGVPTVSIDGETGFTVPPGNVAALAEAIEHLLSSPDLRHQYGEAGRKRVQENFTADEMVRSVGELYRRVQRLDPGLGQAA
jgi:glycosyltransferase involved in cell wall biosynthesis